MELNHEIQTHYNRLEIKEARSYFISEHNKDVQEKIEWEQLFIDGAEKELEFIEEGLKPFNQVHRLNLMRLISEKQDKIDKLRKQILND